MERKLARQPEIKNKYNEFMLEYEGQGHMVRINSEDLHHNNKPTCYLPHHAVFKENSTTTKLRVVFDGSAKTSSGIFFNEVQRVGSVVQNDLFSIIIRFRQHRIVLSADITKMYRQIAVTREHQDLQRILWRKDPSEPIQHFRLATVTYGTASAPFLATRALRQVGEINKEDFPTASHIIIRDFYVDDLLNGAETVEEARQLKSEITQLLASAKFELRKWASNDIQVLENSGHSSTEKIIQSDKDSKTLGLLWNPTLDQLKYSVQEPSQQRTTKRKILSSIAQIFDPLGLVGPVVIKAKIILQRLWQLQVDWDESLPQDLHTIWEDLSNKLPTINEISIDRRVICDNPVTIQLHGFADASESAYGACIYLRSTDSEKNHTVQLLCAKSRVAPLKKISLPRLELQAALLLAQLTDSISAALSLKIDEKYFWSDSTVTFCWIKSTPSQWKTFVANRSSEIQELTNDNWHHVSSQDNPADLISRRVNPEDLHHCKMWWKGPAWLSQDSNTWPAEITANLQDAPEERKCAISIITLSNMNFAILKRYSSLNRLVRVTAYCLHFLNNSRIEKERRKCDNLEAHELARALQCLLKLAQCQDFSSEIQDIRESKQVSRKSKLYSLNPFLDAHGLLRVGGRLVNAPVPFDQKHPIILNPNNPLTALIIFNEHQKLLHAGCQTVIASLRTHYWPLACRNAVKGILRKCIKCVRAKPKLLEPIMGNLPTLRVTPQRAFNSCGVDYAGPFKLIEKLRSRTTVKAYICIFVCFVTKAVHIELARDCSTEAFLNYLRRFVSRRGKGQHIFSDNGTNFVGVRNELNELNTLLCNSDFQKNVQNFLASEQISWHMIPPHAPHFGGLWESAVKSAKRHLLRVIGDTRLTYEELYTVLTQVEACLNSRPLSPQSNDPNDLTPLTPGHFLIGDSLAAIPEPNLRAIPQNRLNRYQHLQYMLQHLWQRWQNEYLSNLQQRHKWAQSKTNLQLVPGTMVIVREDNLPPLKWRLGRITELHQGQDQVTRVVSIRLSDSTIKRPITKICILPVEQELV